MEIFVYNYCGNLKFVTPNYIPVKTIRNANSIGMTGTTGMPTDDGSAQI